MSCFWLNLRVKYIEKEKAEKKFRLGEFNRGNRG